MNGGSNIRAIGQGEDGDVPAVEAPEAREQEEILLEERWEDVEDEAPRMRVRWVVPTLAILAIAGWTAFFAWTYQAEILAGAAPARWIAWSGQWVPPVVLVCAIWLLAMRNSRREAHRFGEVARTLSDEARLLETRLAAANRELSLAREFLASQSRDLDSLGRVAVERLSTHADRLQALVGDNGNQIESIATVSTTALENMTKLRDDLPVIANSARDVSNQIGNAGRTAQGQVAELVVGFERLNQFGEASERQVGSLRERIEEALELFERQLGDVERQADERFAALRAAGEEFRTDLDGREVDALAALRRRADALASELRTAHQALESEEEEALVSLRARLNGLREETRTVGNAVREHEDAALQTWRGHVETVRQELAEAIELIQGIDENALAAASRKLDGLKAEAEAVDRAILERDEHLEARIAARRETLAETEREALEAFAERLEALDAAIGERRAEHAAQTEKIAEHGEAVASRLLELRADMEHVARQGSETEEKLGRAIARLGESLADSRESLGGTSEAVTSLTEASVRLLELIRASAQHSSEELPRAIGDAENRLADLAERTGNLKLLLDEARDTGAQLSDYVVDARETGREAITEIEAFHGRFAESNEGHAGALAGLRSALAELDEQSSALAVRTQGDLREAIAQLEEAARSAGSAVGDDALAKVRDLAERIAAEAGEALDRVLSVETAKSVAEFEAATGRAAASGRDAAVQLRDQLAKVNELAGNLESRVARARERAEERVDNDFARRMALITESLNSSAIDISKALSSEVTDTAWASYLRGDRGIFTRRAVRLLDNVDAREIAGHYDNEPDFRENVNRYVADFEAMLRTMLSTRDGNALGVTLLSSDIGKLYVALAQAIERLRE